MKYFNTGGATGTNTMRAEESSLSSWAGPYVTEMLGRGQALAGLPYQPYMGPLTAGQSALQTQAYQGLGALQTPTAQQTTYTPMSFTGGSFAQPMAQQPMAQQPMAQQPMDKQILGSHFNNIPYYMQDSFDPPPGASMEDFPLEVRQLAEQLRSASQSQATGLGGQFGELGRQYEQALTEKFGADRGKNEFTQLPMFSGNLGPDDRPIGETQGPIERFLATSQPGGLDRVSMPAGAPQQQPMQQSPIQQYMSPYLQGALDPQIAEAQRQAEIQRVQTAGRLGKAGAYGGSRQAIMESEGQRNLLRNLADITGRGYQTAFEQAQQQFNTEQDRQMAAAGQAQRYGLDVLAAQRTAGAEQRGIESEGIAADIKQFEQERDYPYKQVQFMQSLLQGLPLETQSYSYYEPTGLESLAGGAAGVKSFFDVLNEYFGGATGGQASQTDVDAIANQDY